MIVEKAEHEKRGLLHEHEKFWAFILLVVAIIALVILASTFDKNAGTANDLVMQAKLRIIDSAVAGMLTIAGMAAQALFRTSQSEKDLASATRTMAEKSPPMTGAAKDSLEHDASAIEAANAELPEHARG